MKRNYRILLDYSSDTGVFLDYLVCKAGICQVFL